MMGKMGFDIRVDELNENELAFCQKAVIEYKSLRDVILKGDLYRLVSPYEENRAVMMYINNEKTRAVIFGYSLNTRYGETLNRVKLEGLDPMKTYKIREVNVMNEVRRFMGSSENGRSYTGDYLMNIGLTVGSATPLTSVIYELTE